MEEDFNFINKPKKTFCPTTNPFSQKTEENSKCNNNKQSSSATPKINCHYDIGNNGYNQNDVINLQSNYQSKFEKRKLFNIKKGSYTNNQFQHINEPQSYVNTNSIPCDIHIIKSHYNTSQLITNKMSDMMPALNTNKTNMHFDTKSHPLSKNNNNNKYSTFQNTKNLLKEDPINNCYNENPFEHQNTFTISRTKFEGKNPFKQMTKRYSAPAHQQSNNVEGVRPKSFVLRKKSTTNSNNILSKEPNITCPSDVKEKCKSMGFPSNQFDEKSYDFGDDPKLMTKSAKEMEDSLQKDISNINQYSKSSFNIFHMNNNKNSKKKLGERGLDIVNGSTRNNLTGLANANFVSGFGKEAEVLKMENQQDQRSDQVDGIRGLKRRSSFNNHCQMKNGDNQKMDYADAELSLEDIDDLDIMIEIKKDDNVHQFY